MFIFIFSALAQVAPTKAAPVPEVSASQIDTPVLIISLICLCLLIIALLCLAIVKGVRYWRAKLKRDLSLEEDNQAYLELDLDEQELFFQAKEFLSNFPYVTDDLPLSQNLSIQEKGIRAWEMVKDPMLLNSDLIIVNKYELTFFKKFECSAQTNLPIPTTNEVYYFESKIYSLPHPEETMVSIGLGVSPYPWFRLPGRHAHSVSYDSDGYRRHNQPFKFESPAPFPKLIEGDVVGIGYKVRTGTVFFTRNGKKLSELKIGGHLRHFKIPRNGRLYPIIGANNLCSIHVNVGQMGFVYIEGNVKRWGFAPLEGNGPAPPAYKKFNGDILLERSEIDDENDLSERENDFPPDFWDLHQNDEGAESAKFSFQGYSDVSVDERITLHSIIPELPPHYDSSSMINEESEDQANDSYIPYEEFRSALEDTESVNDDNEENENENSLLNEQGDILPADLTDDITEEFTEDPIEDDSENSHT